MKTLLVVVISSDPCSRKRTLLKCLSSITEANCCEGDIYLLDTSHDGSGSELVDTHKGIGYFSLPEKSKPEAVNLAIELVGEYKFIGVIDDDIVLPSHYFQVALEYLQRNYSSNGVGGIYLDTSVERFLPNRSGLAPMRLVSEILGIATRGRTNSIKDSGYITSLSFSRLNEDSCGDWLFGCNAVYRYRVLASWAPFPMGMTGWSYGDDIFVGAQLRAAGCKGSLTIHQAMSVRHLGEASSSSFREDSLKKILYNTFIIYITTKGRSVVADMQYIVNSLALLVFHCLISKRRSPVPYVKLLIYLLRHGGSLGFGDFEAVRRLIL